MKKILNPDLYPAFTLVFALCFMLFFYAPLEIYFNNVNDFWYDFHMLFPYCAGMLLVFCFLGMLLFVLISLLPRKLYQAAVILCLIMLLCTYVQGNFMLDAIPVIDGSEIDWNSFGSQRIYTMILWVAVSALTLAALHFFRYDNFSRAIPVFSICFSLMLFVSLVVLCISHYGLETKGDGVVTDNFAFTLSEDKNFIILMLDAVDGDTLVDLWQDEYALTFQDFTRYDNCMSAYPYTELCVPFLFSDSYFENNMSYRSYYTNAFTKSRFLSELEKEGYRMGLYEPDAIINHPDMYRFENLKQDPLLISSPKEMIKIQIKLAGMRYMPYDLKRYCQVMPGDVPRLRRYSLGISSLVFDESNLAFYRAISDSEITYSDAPCFRFLHIEGAHIPYRYDEFVNEVPEGTGTYEDNVKASMTIAMAYLEKLKQNNVYDNSVIIVMSDHGYNRFQYNAAVGRQHPILLVKGQNEHHDAVQISKAPIAHEDFQSACLNLLSGTPGTDIFDVPEGAHRERRYLFYYYTGMGELQEFLQPGDAGDTDAMISTDRIFRQ